MIRSAIARTLKPTTERKPVKGPRTVKCRAKGCMHRIVPDPANPRVTWCSEDCSVTVALEAGAKRNAAKNREARAAKKAERAALKDRKEKAKRPADHIKDAQTAFNAWVRFRDRELPCICCGRHTDDESRGGVWDAGHYRSRGSAPHLRFDERNVHAQLKSCNRYGAGRAVDYRIGLIARIGIAAVEALEAENELRCWTVDELIAIKTLYRLKLKQLQKEQA